MTHTMLFPSRHPLIQPLEPRTLCARNPAAGGLSNADFNYVQKQASTAVFEQQLAALITSKSSNSSILDLGASLSSDANRALNTTTGNTAAPISISEIKANSGADFNTTNLSKADTKTFNKLTQIKTSDGQSAAFDNAIATTVRKLTNRSINQSRPASRNANANPDVRLFAETRITDQTSLQGQLPNLNVSNQGTLTKTDYQYLQRAAQRATFQIALNELIQEKSFNPAILAFGTALAEDADTVIAPPTTGNNPSAGGSVVAILADNDASYNVNTLSEDDAKLINQLANINTTDGNSTAFDTLVLIAEKKSNQRAIAYARPVSLASGNNPDVKALATLRLSTELQNADTVANL